MLSLINSIKFLRAHSQRLVRLQLNMEASLSTISDQKIKDNDNIVNDLPSPKKQKVEESVANEVKIDSNVPQSAGDSKPDDQAKLSEIKKKKYAFLIGYSGTGYYGLQRNPTTNEFRTIEDEIVDALIKIKAIPENHANEMHKMQFQRAARTDKGVSAAANLINLKMELRDESLKELNDALPEKIRVYGFRKVTQSFDSKNSCEARTYMYLLPTFAFCPIEEVTKEDYRITPEVLKEVNDVLKMYLGTHNFHNFTSGKKFIDPSAKRYIMSMECGRVFVKDNYEFAVITVKGQSFMLHQIRKMIGLAIAVVRGIATKATIDKCWTADKIDMSIAPALGLMLDKLHYDKYNKKFGNDGIHKPLTFVECENEIESFKHKYIYPNVIEKEIEEKSMFNWLSRLCCFNFDKLDGHYQNGAYTGIGKALYNIIQANGDTDKKLDEEDNEGEE